MAFSDIYTAATDPDSSLRKQVAVAIAKAATDVINENPESHENHGQRVEWANKVLSSNAAPVTAAGRWIWKVLENPTIAAAPESAVDGDVTFVVNSIVDIMAQAG